MSDNGSGGRLSMYDFPLLDGCLQLSSSGWAGKRIVASSDEFVGDLCRPELHSGSTEGGRPSHLRLRIARYVDHSECSDLVVPAAGMDPAETVTHVLDHPSRSSVTGVRAV